MISRLTTIALSVATLATASLAFAASTHAGVQAAPVVATRTVGNGAAPVLQLERVVIVGKRLPQ